MTTNEELNFDLLSWSDKNRFSYDWDFRGDNPHEVCCYNIPFSCSLILVRRMWNVFWRWNREEKNWNGTRVPNSSGSVLVWLFLVLVNFYCHLELNFKITFLLDYCWVKEKVFLFFLNIVVFNLGPLFNSFVPVLFLLKFSDFDSVYNHFICRPWWFCLQAFH